MADRMEELKAKRTPLEDAIWRMRYEFPPKPIDVDLVCNAAERLVAEVERLRAERDAECGRLQDERDSAEAEVERLRAELATSTQDVAVVVYEAVARAEGMEAAAKLLEGVLDTRAFFPGQDLHRKGWNECRTAGAYAIRAKANE